MKDRRQREDGTTYTTPTHGKRAAHERRKNKAARAARKRQRRKARV